MMPWVGAACLVAAAVWLWVARHEIRATVSIIVEEAWDAMRKRDRG